MSPGVTKDLLKFTGLVDLYITFDGVLSSLIESAILHHGETLRASSLCATSYNSAEDPVSSTRLLNLSFKCPKLNELSIY